MITAFAVPSRIQHLPYQPNFQQKSRTILALKAESKGAFPFYDKSNPEKDLLQIEKEVLANAQAKQDEKIIKDILLNENKDRSELIGSSLGRSRDLRDTSTAAPSTWMVALAAGIATGGSSFVFLHTQLSFSFLIFLVTIFFASRDPFHDSNIIEGEEVAGPIARMIGRATLTSIEKSKPKVRAIAKAAITGSADVEALLERVYMLEKENEELKIWIQRRKFVDEKVGIFKLDDLKSIARNEGLKVGGTKKELMMRLIEADLLNLD